MTNRICFIETSTGRLLMAATGQLARRRHSTRDHCLLRASPVSKRCACIELRENGCTFTLASP
jgi:hypothetical protein